ncbi:hypothetical protein [Hyphomicrobium sp.]|uniref:hypothetical protein n=1 Tax=Hyphomicrobium sp. TaxID=82 RepID=UPI000FBBEEE3|nr:hypothetical protein [Hyphomicrobium sp.]RUP00553.1 MAG: autotransporter outer membrane beta-barrel domain-containing protein [Hyphomicrobium sp.]
MRHRFSDFGKVGLLAAGMATSWSAIAAAQGLPCGMASAAGGSGPPSISETETSTTEVLEQIRRRVQVAQQAPIPVSNTVAMAEPGSSSGTSVEQQATTSAAQAQAGQVSNSATLKSKRAVASSDYAANPRYASLKDYGTATDAVYEGQTIRSTATWAQGFGGYERHSNLAPGNDENPTRNQVSGGGMAGMDWTVIKRGETLQAFQFGVFSGFSETNDNFSNTSFRGTVDTTNDVTFSRTNNSQDVNGPFVGAYLAYATGAWTFDLAFKADFFDLSQRSSLSANTTCGADVFLNGSQHGSASVNDYIIAGEASHRTPLSATSWIEPAFGIRFTATNFSNDTNSANFGTVQGTTLNINGGSLGLDDGTSLRLQGGVRYGEIWQTPQGYHVTTTVGAFLYSDVLITGFNTQTGIVAPGGSLNTVGPVDEGKIRGLGQLTTQLDAGGGWSYLLMTEVYGGEDVVGVDGQLGVRYHW